MADVLPLPDPRDCQPGQSERKVRALCYGIVRIMICHAAGRRGDSSHSGSLGTCVAILLCGATCACGEEAAAPDKAIGCGDVLGFDSRLIAEGRGKPPIAIEVLGDAAGTTSVTATCLGFDEAGGKSCGSFSVESDDEQFELAQKGFGANPRFHGVLKGNHEDKQVRVTYVGSKRTILAIAKLPAPFSIRSPEEGTRLPVGESYQVQWSPSAANWMEWNVVVGCENSDGASWGWSAQGFVPRRITEDNDSGVLYTPVATNDFSPSDSCELQLSLLRTESGSFGTSSDDELTRACGTVVVEQRRDVTLEVFGAPTE